MGWWYDLGVQRPLDGGRSRVPQILGLPRVGADVVQLAKVNLIEDVRLVPLGVAEVVRGVHHT